jgi:hypothetical protein
MEQKQGNTLFPGRKKGVIRVFIKRGKQEGIEQLRFNLFEEESSVKQ